MSAHSKNPYEIRADMLQLAASICLERHRAAFAKANNGTTQHMFGPETAPSAEDIIEEAKKLYGFVEKSR